MKIREIHRQTWVDQSPEVVFNFFANPDNLLKVTPDTIPVKILNEDPIEMREGAEINLRMKLFGFIPVSWQTRISEWVPPHYFVDIQPRGPYQYWKHTHRFEEQDGGTLIVDEVEYAVPGWILEPIIHALAVRSNLEHLFDYRQEMYPRFLNRG